jgi:hypothetical protein
MTFERGHPQRLTQRHLADPCRDPNEAAGAEYGRRGGEIGDACPVLDSETCGNTATDNRSGDQRRQREADR